MDDPFDANRKPTLEDYWVRKTVLSPEQWRIFGGTNIRQWRATKFERKNAKQIPDTQHGVYSFMVQPGIARHSCAYLMYVGKAQKLSLRKRFVSYFDEAKSRRRVHIAKMLKLWEGHLWFYYTPVKDQAKIPALEDALLNAFLPPYNHQYEATVAQRLKYMFS